MKSTSQLIHGGGWFTRQTIGKPRARFFGFLSAIWLLVSLCASYPFWGGWPETLGYLEWLCGALLIPQPVLVILAAFFWLTEPRRIITEEHPNPDCDIRKLY